MPLTDDYSSKIWYSSKGATNNTTPVTVITDPGVSQFSFVCEEGGFSILNLDTASITFTLIITGGTSRIIERITMSPGDKFTNGNKYVVAPGETITVALAGAIATTQPTWSTSWYQMIS